MKHFLIQKKEITKADNGGAVVILNIKDYIDEANRQVNETNNYEQLNQTSTQQSYILKK